MKRKRQTSLNRFFNESTNDQKNSSKSKCAETSAVKWKNVSRDGLDIRYAVILPISICDIYFRNLEEEVTYLTGDSLKVQVFGKWHKIPRKHSAYGDNGIKYTYSGVSIPAKPWTKTLYVIKEIIEKITLHSYNFVLVNRYANGNDKMSFHKDDEKELDMTVPIASFSLGASRDFVFKYHDKNCNKPKESIVLESGMLLLMEKDTNKLWYHGLPVRKSCFEPRINLTFRKIL